MSNGSAVGSETAATESISPYAAPYVTEMLGKGQALAATPYQAYTGPLTAGPSALQSQAFSGLGSLALPAASGAGSFTGAAYGLPTDGTTPQLTTSPTSIVQQYMNPYLEAALNPAIQRVKDETTKAQQELQSQYAQAGAYGGGRQAVAEAGLQNRALDRIGDITAQGYQTAYDKAAQLFGDERRYGLDALRAQQLGGREQRDIEQRGVAADYAQFKEERDDPFKKVQYMQSLLQGLPIEAVTRDYIEPSGLSQFLSDLGLLGTAGQLFFGKDTGIFPLSDIRLKENITHVGVLPNGANWYTWDWNETGKAIAVNQPTQGVMAQELQEINADAVITGSDGYLRVDYSKV
tara:strand:- start:958 stop:2004 length:1047 start_codon:yes stop_codon:yes gene_type:complete